MDQNLERTITAEQRAISQPYRTRTASALPGPAKMYAFKRALKKFGVDHGIDRAAMLTYYAVLSLAPTLLAVFSILTLVLSSAAGTVENFAEDLVAQMVPAEYQDLALNLVSTMTDSASGGIIALIVGTAVALWSASAYVKAFARNMNHVYGVVEGRSFVRATLTMLAVTLSVVLIVVAILISLVLNLTIVEAVFAPVAQVVGAESTLTSLTETFLPVWQWAKYPVVLALVILLTGVLYQFTGNVERKFRFFSAGAIFSVVGILLAGVAMVIYLTYFASYSSYGMIGTLMALLFVIWVFNIVMFMGAEIDVEILRARQLVAGVPAEHYVQVRPRSVATVEKQAEAYESRVDDAVTLRRTYASLEVADD